MISSFYTAAAGTVQLKYGVDVIANNIANANNSGYKASGASFSDLVYTNIREPEDALTRLEAGHGTKLGETKIDFEQGTLQPTQNLTDFAISGDGFFAVATDDGIKYTRTGSAFLTQDADGTFYLASTLGGLLLDKDYQPIAVSDINTQEIPLGVFGFDNNDGLIRDGGNFFVPGETSGNIHLTENASVRQGYLEASSVDIAGEMSDLIAYQRAFQFSSKMVQIPTRWYRR